MESDIKGSTVATVIVNRFYQGVVLPPNTSEVKLFLRPFVLWNWLPQLLFATSGALLLLGSALQIRGRQRGVRLSSADGSQPP
jgi:hypothetical protein